MAETKENIPLEDSNLEEGKTVSEPPQPPDGGRRGWLTAIGAGMNLFATIGYLYSFGVYQDYYSRFYLSSHTPSKIAWIGSLQITLPFTLGVVSGKLFDNGYFHALQAAGSTLFVVSLFLLSLAKPQKYFEIFLSQGVGMGLRSGISFIATVGITSHHFRRRRALAAGVALSGSSLGAVVFPIMLNNLLPKIGFAQTVRASAYIVLGLLIVSNCLMRTPHAKVVSDRPVINIKGFFVDPPYLSTGIGAFFGLFGFYFPLVYLQLYANTHGIDPNLAFYSIAILNASSIFGRIFANWLADMFGAVTVMIPCTVLTAASIFSVFGIHDSASLIVVSIFYGFFSGAWISVSVAILASLSRHPTEIGARTGLGLAFCSFGSLGGAPLQGRLLTSMFKWNLPIIFSGILMSVSTIFFVATRVILVREWKTQKV
ncbi:MFS general substrate transporter [Agrocybe pediades]|nr:MFS general substrate transporter [Agrocybe pediades]